MVGVVPASYFTQMLPTVIRGTKTVQEVAGGTNTTNIMRAADVDIRAALVNVHTVS